MAKSKLTIFISSPGDVAPERALLREVIQRINASLHEIVLTPYFSEDDTYFASHGPQLGIPLSSQFDLVVCVYWKRMGSKLLPEQFDAPDGRKRTGSEFEFETAVAAARATHLSGATPVPAMLVYRKTQAITYSAEKVDEERAQHQALDAFFERWIKDAEGHFLGYANRFDNAEQLAEIFERHVRDWIALQRRATTWDVAKDGSPYRGLEVFDLAHERVYFGRNRAILAGRAQLKKAAEDGFPVLWLVGASGSGKSSLLRAGLVPSLLRSEGALRSLILRPSELGADLMTGFATLLLRTLPELTRGSFPKVSQLSSLFAPPNSEPALQVLRAALDQWAAAEQRSKALSAPPRTRLLLGIDQAEELLTQRSATEREQLTRHLSAWVDSDLLWLALSFRSDFYALMQRDARLVPLKARAHQLDIAAPSAAEFAEMIEGPARAAGLTLEVNETGRALRDELCLDANGAESLPMLEFALLALHQRAIARGDQQLKLEDYDAMGRAAGALSAAAEASLQALPDSVKAAFPKLLRELVELNLQSSDRAPTARSCQRADFEGDSAAKALIKALVDARLLTQFDEHLRVAHESLFKHWPRAKAQIELDARRLDARRRLTEAHALWQLAQSKYRSKRLLSGLGLQEGLDLDRAWTLPADLSSFVKVSERAAQKQKQNLRMGVAALALLAVLAIWALSFALQQWDAAQNTLVEAAERSKGRAVEALEKQDTVTSLAYFSESLRYVDDPAVKQIANLILQLTPSFEAPGRIQISTPVGQIFPSGNLHGFVTIDEKRKLDFWSFEPSNGIKNVFSTRSDGVSFVFDAEGGLYLASGYSIKKINALGTLEAKLDLNIPISYALDNLPLLEISKRGNVIATIGEKWVEIYTINKIGPNRRIPSNFASGINLSCDGRFIFVKNSTQSSLYNVSSQKIIEKFSGQVQGEFSCANNLMFTWRKNNITRRTLNHHASAIDSLNLDSDIINVIVGPLEELIFLVTQHAVYKFNVLGSNFTPQRIYNGNDIKSVKISPDGRRILIYKSDDSIVLWDIASAKKINPGFENGGGVADAIPVGAVNVATLGEDGIVRVWDTKNHAPLPGIKRVPSEIPTVFADRIGKKFAVQFEAGQSSNLLLCGTENDSCLAKKIDCQGYCSSVNYNKHQTFAAVTFFNNRNFFDRKRAMGISLVDVDSGYEVRMPAPHHSGAFPSLDGKYVALVDNNALDIFSFPSMKSLFGVIKFEGEIIDLVFLDNFRVEVELRNKTRLEISLLDGNAKTISNKSREFLIDSGQELRLASSALRIGNNYGLNNRIISYAQPFGQDLNDIKPGNCLYMQSDYAVKYWPIRRLSEVPAVDVRDAIAVVSGYETTASGTIIQLNRNDRSSRAKRLTYNRGSNTDFQKIMAWHGSDYGTRTISPFSVTTVPAYIQSEVDWALAHIRDGSKFGSQIDLDLIPDRTDSRLWRELKSVLAQRQTDYKPLDSISILNNTYNLDPSHPLILFALSVFETHPETKALWKRLSFPRIEAQPEYATRAAEILQQDKDPENAMKAALIALKHEPNNPKALAVKNWANTELAKAQSP